MIYKQIKIEEMEWLTHDNLTQIQLDSLFTSCRHGQCMCDTLNYPHTACLHLIHTVWWHVMCIVCLHYIYTQYVIYTYTLCLHIIDRVNWFTCNIGFSSLYVCHTQPQRGCLWCPHINPVDTVNDSCQCSGGTVRSDPGCGYSGF